jgi:CRP/FNR family transcriptional regulator, cyclic AMP receptor protein
MLQGIPLFAGLTDSEKSTVELFAQERMIKSGEILFHEGDEATAMYIVKAGNLKAFKDRSSGEQILGFVTVGEMVGEMALFDANAPKRRLASVKSVEDSRLLVIVDYAIVELSRKHPIVYEKIKAVIDQRRQANDAKSMASQV